MAPRPCSRAAAPANPSKALCTENQRYPRQQQERRGSRASPPQRWHGQANLRRRRQTASLIELPLPELTREKSKATLSMGWARKQERTGLVRTTCCSMMLQILKKQAGSAQTS